MTVNKDKQNIEIRDAVEADFDVIMALLADLNPNDPPPSEQHLANYQEILARPYFDLILISLDQQAIGCCYLNQIPNLSRNASPYALIENVVIAKSCQRQGYGKQLIQFAVARAKSQACYKVMLLSGRFEQSVVSFYQACGFSDDSKQGFVLYLNTNL